jgi:hypothetical protein
MKDQYDFLQQSAFASGKLLKTLLFFSSIGCAQLVF